MSYLSLRPQSFSTAALARARGRGTVHGVRVGLGMPSDVIEGLKFRFGMPSEELRCLETANASAKVKEIDGRIEDLSKNWRPTGFYTPAQLRTVYNEIMGLIAQGNAALNTAMASSTSDGVSQVNQARAYLTRAAQRGAIYAQALTNAAANNVNVIDSPGLTTWVLQSMVNVSQAFTTVEALACQSTWLDYAAALITKVWRIIKEIAGVIAKIGETILKVADSLPTIATVLLWGGVAAAGVFAVMKLAEYHKRSAG